MLPDIRFINAHTHLSARRAGWPEIISLRYTQAPADADAWYSAGLHPWFLEESTLNDAFEWLAEQALLSHIVAIGESGLDKLCETPWELQLIAFQRSVEISEQVQKPLVVHCVRAFNEIVALKKQWKPAQDWMIHGFDKNPETAELLLQQGCYLSFGRPLLHARSRSSEALRITPADRFFLETDGAPDISIESIYERAAFIREISLETLSAQLENNCRKVFKM